MIKDNLSDYNFPADLKGMSLTEMDELALSIRKFLIEKVSKTGGHIASNLGIVELTIALHHYFDSPTDKILWDVGHQSYVHKILTGRAGDFDNLRALNGMSGFPKMCESEHDIVDMGHSSNSVSIASGIAAARDAAGDNYNVVAVIGDGALTGGEAYEAVNNLGYSKSKVIVILNDNGMSISKNTGGISKHLSSMRTSKGYQGFKLSVKNALKNAPGVYKSVEHLKDSLKYAIVDGVIFEEMGLTYLGPVNGHSIEDILDVLALASRVQGPVLIHVHTQKGKGYEFAEKNPGKFHGIGAFNPETGEVLSSDTISYSRVFGDKLLEMAKRDKRITAVSAAMTDGTGLKRFSEIFPDRMYDVGIAEQHAVSFAAGLARNGYRPFVAIYSTFLQRAYDQIMMDVCLNNLPVVFAIDRAGCVGQDGQTHHGLFDLSYLSHMPNLTVLSPRDGIELESMMEYALTLNGPAAIRYPRGSVKNFGTFKEFDGHNYFMVNHSSSASDKVHAEIWATGKMTGIGEKVSAALSEQGYRVNLINAAVITPPDINLITSAKNRTKMIVTLEDNVVTGGFGQMLGSIVLENELDIKVHNIGWPVSFIEQGDTESLMKRYGLDADSITERIREFIEGQTRCDFSK